MSMNRHEPWEELVSASLTGDLTADERPRLDAHLDTCASCRATLASFADGRRMVAGLRHVPPPRDLGARVRTGIESGSRVGLPWWRRPAAVFAGVGGSLAVVAGALAAVLVLNAPGDSRPVGEATPSVAVASATSSEKPTPDPLVAPPPTATPIASEPPPSPSDEPEPTATPVPADPEPDLYLALTGPFDNLALTVRVGETGDTLFEPDTPSGPPIAAELSPDGQWLAYITLVGESGHHEVRATRVAMPLPPDDPEQPPVDSPVAVGDTVLLGESVAGSPFLEQLAWASPRGDRLAYTLADPDGGGSDVWIFEPGAGEPYRLTEVGNAYAGSWVPDDESGSSRLWVSLAGSDPVSHLVSLDGDAGGAGTAPIDPADNPVATAEGVFQPLLSSNGALAIYWRGRMEQAGAEWLFSEGAAPHLAEHRSGNDGAFELASERPVFSDLTIRQSAFASAAITWGPDGDAYAIWAVRWTGTSQGPDGVLYPDETAVYFGHATDPRGLTRTHAIDAGDIPEGSRAVDVKVSPTGRHLVITAARPRGGVQEAPAADLLLVTRNTGTVADEVEVMESGDRGWFGPAAVGRMAADVP